MPWRVRENAAQVAIVNVGQLSAILGLALVIVLRERLSDCGDWLHPLPCGEDGWLLRDVVPELVDVLEFLEGRPAGIAFSPCATRPQPDRVRFGEVLIRMALRIP